MAKPELTDYELKDGAYGLYLQKEGGYMDDVDIGSHYYPKEEVDALVESMEKRIKKVNKHLKELRGKYKELYQLRTDAEVKCKELSNIIGEMQKIRKHREADNG